MRVGRSAIWMVASVCVVLVARTGPRSAIRSDGGGDAPGKAPAAEEALPSIPDTEEEPSDDQLADEEEDDFEPEAEDDVSGAAGRRATVASNAAAMFGEEAGNKGASKDLVESRAPSMIQGIALDAL